MEKEIKLFFKWLNKFESLGYTKEGIKFYMAEYLKEREIKLKNKIEKDCMGRKDYQGCTRFPCCNGCEYHKPININANNRQQTDKSAETQFTLIPKINPEIQGF